MSTAIALEELRAAIDDASVRVIDALPPAPFGQRHRPGALSVVAEDTPARRRCSSSRSPSAAPCATWLGEQPA